MAEPTEAEQQKTNKSLESLDKKADNQQTSLQKLTSIIKEGNAYSVMAHEESMGQDDDSQELDKLRTEILRKNTKVQEKSLEAAEKSTNEEKDARKKKEGKDAVKAGKDDKANKNSKSWFERSGHYFDSVLKDAKNKDFFDRHKVKLEGGFFTRQLKFLHILSKSSKDQEALAKQRTDLAKEGNRFQRLAHSMAVRAAKLALRAKPIVDWGVKGLGKMKDKAFDWIKSLGKLLVLLGIWGAALWLDANMLKEDWEKLKEKLTAWKDKLIAWWGELDGALTTVTKWWGKIKTWFEDTFGVELKLWHVALVAFGLWMFGPKLAFLATMALAKTGIWAAKKLLQKMGIWPKDLPDPKAVQTDADGAKKKAKGKASWWKRMFGLADDATKKLPIIDPKTGRKFATETARVNSLWGEWGKNVSGHADELDNLNKSIADNPTQKKGFFKTLGAKFKTMFSTVGDWAGSIGDKVGGWFKGAKSSVGGWFKGAMDTAKGLGSSIVEKGSKIVKGVGDMVKGAGSAIAKIPGIQTAGKFLGGTAKTLAKVLAPIEAIRGTWAGFAKQGPDDERTMNQRMDDASAGMVKGLSDFFVTDLLELGGLVESKIRGKGEGETFLGGLADKTQEWSDKTFGKWKEGTQLFDAAGNPLALRLDPPEWKKKRREAQAQKADLLSMTKALGLTEETTRKAGRGGAVKTQIFDKEGFQKLLLGASKAESFAMMQQMVAGLAKAGKISAEDAERYKMDISKEQAAGTPPIIINNSPTTNNSGSTSMIAASSANDPMKEVLKDW